ncbi:MAG TPA: hypothetical protein VGZ22_03195 [Isosphaeraceae bacterium]|jgi:hypothetical protein|nr:hypothetical protein [Isosphaeraceae bacterium]
MAQQTEAECLLQTGAMYTRRLGLRPTSRPHDLVFAGLKHGAFSIYFGDEPIYHFDLEGRWQRAFVEGVHYLKGLDNSVDAIDRVREGANLVLHRRALSFAETGDFDASVRSMAIRLISDLESGGLEPIAPPSPTASISRDDLRGFLDRVVEWDAAAWFAHRERYLGTYGTLGFLPSEAQQAVILQATLGHARGAAFGLAPPAEPYKRSEAEFQEHASAVAAFLGKRALQCRGAYVAGTDLFHLPADQVAAYLRITAEVFPIDPAPVRLRARDVPDEPHRLESLYAFLDNLDPPLPDLAAWCQFKELALRRVVVGVESGDRQVRTLYGKTWEDDALRRLVADLKAAGLEVGIVLLVGAGGQERADEHVAASAALLNALPLGPGDLVYLIEADEVGGEAARRKLQELDITPLSDQAALEQQKRLLSLLAPIRKERKAKVAPYHLEKQRT